MITAKIFFPLLLGTVFASAAKLKAISKEFDDDLDVFEGDTGSESRRSSFRNTKSGSVSEAGASSKSASKSGSRSSGFDGGEYEYVSASKGGASSKSSGFRTFDGFSDKKDVKKGSVSSSKAGASSLSSSKSGGITDLFSIKSAGDGSSSSAAAASSSESGLFNAGLTGVGSVSALKDISSSGAMASSSSLASSSSSMLDGGGLATFVPLGAAASGVSSSAKAVSSSASSATKAVSSSASSSGESTLPAIGGGLCSDAKAVSCSSAKSNGLDFLTDGASGIKDAFSFFSGKGSKDCIGNFGLISGIVSSALKHYASGSNLFQGLNIPLMMGEFFYKMISSSGKLQFPFFLSPLGIFLQIIKVMCSAFSFDKFPSILGLFLGHSLNQKGYFCKTHAQHFSSAFANAVQSYGCDTSDPQKYLNDLLSCAIKFFTKYGFTFAEVGIELIKVYFNALYRLSEKVC